MLTLMTSQEPGYQHLKIVPGRLHIMTIPVSTSLVPSLIIACCTCVARIPVLKRSHIHAYNWGEPEQAPH